jgi:hypothetical protein
LVNGGVKRAKASEDDESHLYGYADGDEEGRGEDEEEEESPAQEAQRVLKEYITWCTNEVIKNKEKRRDVLSKYPQEAVHKWWRDVGRKKWPIMVPVVRACLSMPAGSGNLERYFCTIPAVVTRTRSSLSPARVEMIIMTHILQKVRRRLQPDEVLRLSAEQALRALPGRMKKIKLMEQLKELLQGMDLLEEEADLSERPDVLEAMAPWSSIADLLSTDTGLGEDEQD